LQTIKFSENRPI